MEVPADSQGVWPRTPAEQGGHIASPSPDTVNDLLLDLRGCDYSLGSSGTWTNRATIGKTRRIDAAVPAGVEFDEKEKAFRFHVGGDCVRAPLATNPQAHSEVTYAAWVKVEQQCANLGWIICQHPDHGWSRALTLNDYRLGHISVTTSHYWDSELGQAPLGEWIHVAGVWHNDGTATVYLNGNRGATASTNNGKSAYHSDEELMIGGRSPFDSAHNCDLLVSEVCVFARALCDEEVAMLHSCGRTLEALEESSCMLMELNLNTMGCSAQTAKKRVSAENVAAEPIWDDRTKLFWCNTGLDAHDVPDGSMWQQNFKSAVNAAMPEVTNRVRTVVDGPQRPTRTLARNSTDASNPDVSTPTAKRTLGRFPSDPDKRAVRAAHTEALRRMTTCAGIERRILGRNVALFRFDGRVFAVDALCPHQGAHLCEGEVGDIEDLVEGHRFYVRCKVHKFQFDLTTGTVIDGQCGSLRVYKARVRERETSPDGARKATIEVGFETLPADYFAPVEDVDF